MSIGVEVVKIESILDVLRATDLSITSWGVSWSDRRN